MSSNEATDLVECEQRQNETGQLDNSHYKQMDFCKNPFLAPSVRGRKSIRSNKADTQWLIVRSRYICASAIITLLHQDHQRENRTRPKKGFKDGYSGGIAQRQNATAI